MPGADAFHVMGWPDFTTLDGFHSAFLEVVFTTSITGSAKHLFARILWEFRAMNSNKKINFAIKFVYP